MSEIATFRKNKIELTEYDCSKDVQNRVLMASFTPLEVEVLEEILYSSLRIPITLLEQNLEVKEGSLLPLLEKLSQTGLFKVSADHVLVEKEMRKYYEFQILKFEEDFKPGMEYLQGLLRKVPIHVLPTWYSISRTSNNIFESIVEKYLETPQTFQRYLMDLSFSDPVQNGIMSAIYNSSAYEVDAQDIMEKYDLSQERFEEHMLHLEFSFIACVKYEKEKNKFRQIITPFQEWKEYLSFVQHTEPKSIFEEEKIKRFKNSDYAVIDEISMIVELASKRFISKADAAEIKKRCPQFDPNHFDAYVSKLTMINLLSQKGREWTCTSDSVDWLKMDTRNRALYLYRHPLNYLDAPHLPEDLCQHKTVREAEKTLCRAVDAGWIYLEDFIKGIFIPLKEEHSIQLQRLGRIWKYRLPEYTKEEIAFFKAIVQNWAFGLGLTALGTIEGRECFTLTPLGQDLFSNE